MPTEACDTVMLIYVYVYYSCCRICALHIVLCSVWHQRCSRHINRNRSRRNIGGRRRRRRRTYSIWYAVAIVSACAAYMSGLLKSDVFPVHVLLVWITIKLVRMCLSSCVSFCTGRLDSYSASLVCCVRNASIDLQHMVLVSCEAICCPNQTTQHHSAYVSPAALFTSQLFIVFYTSGRTTVYIYYKASSAMYQHMPPLAEGPIDELTDSFHEYLAQASLAKHKLLKDYRRSYKIDLHRSMTMLAHNADHANKPAVITLTNCAYIFKDPHMNFWDVISSDPLLATWTAHQFICYSEDKVIQYMHVPCAPLYAAYVHIKIYQSSLTPPPSPPTLPPHTPKTKLAINL